MGIETEYAATGFAVDHPANGSGVFNELNTAVRGRVPCLEDGSSAGIFLANGARFYYDSGHPEYATPECGSPREVLAAIRAGERLLSDAAARASGALRKVAVFRSNVDYGGERSTWGCHESYLHRTPPRLLPDLLIPHFVSRLIYTGAGGFMPNVDGIEFTLSPRASMLECAVSGTSTSTRGIFHTKDETLSCDGYHRLHVICGESLCEGLGTLLKVGTTALIVAAIDAGWNVGQGLAYRSAIDALRVASSDQTLGATVATARGHRVTAISVQREYLKAVEACRQAGLLPMWADEICGLWSTTLEHLARNDGWARSNLDWGRKQALFEQWAGGRSSWDGLRSWNTIWHHVKTQTTKAVNRLSEPTDMSLHGILFGENCPVPDDKARLTRYLASKQTDWAGLRKFLRLRHELFEIDVRFGQLGAGGIHAQLSASGLTGPELVSDEQVAHAVQYPPAGGRAMVRGQLIRSLSQNESASAFMCGWTRVWDRRDRLFVDLSDPFGTSVVWQRYEHAEARRSMLEFCRGVWSEYF